MKQLVKLLAVVLLMGAIQISTPQQSSSPTMMRARSMSTRLDTLLSKETLSAAEKNEAKSLYDALKGIPAARSLVNAYSTEDVLKFGGVPPLPPRPSTPAPTAKPTGPTPTPQVSQEQISNLDLEAEEKKLSSLAQLIRQGKLDDAAKQEAALTEGYIKKGLVITGKAIAFPLKATYKFGATTISTGAQAISWLWGRLGATSYYLSTYIVARDVITPLANANQGLQNITKEIPTGKSLANATMAKAAKNIESSVHRAFSKTYVGALRNLDKKQQELLSTTLKTVIASMKDYLDTADFIKHNIAEVYEANESTKANISQVIAAVHIPVLKAISIIDEAAQRELKDNTVDKLVSPLWSKADSMMFQNSRNNLKAVHKAAGKTWNESLWNWTTYLAGCAITGAIIYLCVNKYQTGSFMGAGNIPVVDIPQAPTTPGNANIAQNPSAQTGMNVCDAEKCINVATDASVVEQAVAQTQENVGSSVIEKIDSMSETIADGLGQDVGNVKDELTPSQETINKFTTFFSNISKGMELEHTTGL